MSAQERYRTQPPQLRESGEPPRARLISQVYRASSRGDTGAIVSLLGESVTALGIRKRKGDVENVSECVQTAYVSWREFTDSQRDAACPVLMDIIKNYGNRVLPWVVGRATAIAIALDEPQLIKSPKDIFEAVRTGGKLNNQVVALDRQRLDSYDLEYLVSPTHYRGVEIGLIYYPSIDKYLYFQGNSNSPQSNPVQVHLASGLGWEKRIDLHTHPGRGEPGPSGPDLGYFQRQTNTRYFIYGEHETSGENYYKYHGWYFQQYDNKGGFIGDWLNMPAAAQVFNDIHAAGVKSSGLPKRR